MEPQQLLLAFTGAMMLALMAGTLMHLFIALDFAAYVIARAAVIIVGAAVAGYWWWRKQPCRLEVTWDDEGNRPRQELKCPEDDES